MDKFYSWAESYEMCQQGRCRYHTFDMDGAYCAHPISLKMSGGFGCSLNRMISEGLCTGCNDDPSKNLRQLFEQISQDQGKSE